MKHRLLAILLCLCLLVAAAPYAAFAEEKAETVTGTVYGLDTNLRIRQEPNTDAEVLGRLYNDDVVTILATSKDEKWYQIRTADDIVGWASTEFIRIETVEDEPTYTTDEEFEEYLTAQGFPDSYKEPLRQLFAKHPKWVFEAKQLNVTWAEALAGESVALKNSLNINDYPEAWLSMEYGAYDWKKGNYVQMDSGGWMTASKEIIAYFMDPRNFLDDTYIYQFESLLYSPHHTTDGIKSILPSRYDGYAADVLKAAKDANVNAYFLATRMTQEGSKIDGSYVGDGGVSYKGYYNFFNIGAYSGSQHGSYHGALTNGAIYAQKQGWDSPYKCIVGSAEYLGRSYIHKAQNTTYFQKFNVAGENLYNHQYMSNVNAPTAESKIRAGKITDAELAGGMTFILPVYKDMPEKAAPKPSSKGDNNNFLDSLTVEGFAVSPTFDRYTMEYAAEVTKETTKVTITAVANNKEAAVKGTGTIQLYAGENLLPVTVTATSGQVRTYTLSVFCEAEDVPERPEEPTEPDKPTEPTEPDKPTEPPTSDTTDTTTTTTPSKPSVSAKDYTVDKVVTGIPAETAVKDLLAKLTVKNGTAKIATADGQEKKEGVAGTGDLLQIFDKDNKMYASYPLLIYGDVNGDGKINSQDLRRTQRHILAAAKLEGVCLSAADTNNDGKVNSQDLRRIQRYILKTLDTLYSPKEE